MIGNDIVDLELARKESNWQRKGYLNKIFTKKEQFLIQSYENQEIMVWNLWSRKEAAYKIWNREMGLRKFIPTKFECFDIDLEIGKVKFENTVYYTKSEIGVNYIYTIAVSKPELFVRIRTLENSIEIKKKNGIPFCINKKNEILPISKSHHGRFEKLITII